MLKCSPLWKTTSLVWPAETELCGGAQERQESSANMNAVIAFDSLDFLSLRRCDRLRLHFLCSGRIPKRCTEKSGFSSCILILACPSQSVPRCSLAKRKPTFLFLGSQLPPLALALVKKQIVQIFQHQSTLIIEDQCVWHALTVLIICVAYSRFKSSGRFHPSVFFQRDATSTGLRLNCPYIR